MWESSRILMDWASVCQKITGNPAYLRAMATQRKSAKSRARYCGISQIDVIEQLIEWEIPDITGTERDLRRESVRQSILAHWREVHHDRV